MNKGIKIFRNAYQNEQMFVRANISINMQYAKRSIVQSKKLHY